jgi:hypothetical protein
MNDARARCLPASQTGMLLDFGSTRTIHCIGGPYAMLIARKVVIDDIYIPVGRRNTLHPETVRLLAEDILENGLKAPIRVRHDGKRYILVEGLHRMEAMKWLGDVEIDAYLVQAQKH